MKAILEFEKPDLRNLGNFYRYNIDGNKVWFSKDDKGRIYKVTASSKTDDFEIYIDVSDDCKFEKVYFDINQRKVKLNEIDDMISKLNYLKKLGKAIEEIFGDKEK